MSIVFLYILWVPEFQYTYFILIAIPLFDSHAGDSTSIYTGPREERPGCCAQISVLTAAGFRSRDT